ncbi:hypothetical protein HMPREF9422_0305 [Streptococcus cristatus ATCC 51100]|nr:hypothetical protein HMPREF9422_0305 [Streptococcus cristatus ATCC 51100]
MKLRTILCGGQNKKIFFNLKFELEKKLKSFDFFFCRTGFLI